jgi:hypothetical protein
MAGTGHEFMNASLLNVLLTTFPEASISFLAESNHLAAVRYLLELSGVNPLPDLVPVREGKYPDPLTVDSQKAQRQLITGALHQGLSGSDCVIYASALPETLLELAAVVRRGLHCSNTHVVHHGSLETLLRPSILNSLERKRYGWAIRPSRFTYSLHRALDALSGSGVAFISLAPHIPEQVPVSRHRGSRLSAIRMPILPLISAQIQPNDNRFGVLGRMYRRELLEFLHETAHASPAGDFEVRIFGSKLRNTPHVSQVSYLATGGSHIPRLELEAELGRVAALIYLYRKGDFRVSMSGAFFESLAHGIPAMFSMQPSMRHANALVGGRLGLEFESPGHLARALTSTWLADELRGVRLQLPSTLRTWNHACSAELRAALGA